jgi:hypothetical protein
MKKTTTFFIAFTVFCSLSLFSASVAVAATQQATAVVMDGQKIIEQEIITALEVAAQYDIYDTQVLMQELYSRNGEPMIILWALSSLHQDIKPGSYPDKWEIQITLSYRDASRKTKVIVKNAKRLGPKDKEKRKLGQAALIAAKTFIQKSPYHLRIPMYIKVTHVGTEYYCNFYTNIVGDVKHVILDGNLKVTSMYGGGR